MNVIWAFKIRWEIIPLAASGWNSGNGIIIFNKGSWIFNILYDHGITTVEACVWFCRAILKRILAVKCETGGEVLSTSWVKIETIRVLLLFYFNFFFFFAAPYACWLRENPVEYNGMRSRWEILEEYEIYTDLCVI